MDYLVYSWQRKMVLWTHFVEASIINAHSPFPGLLFIENRIGKPIGVVHLLDEFGARSLATSSPMALCLSSSKRHRHCLVGFEPRTRHNVCSATSRSMPSMSKGFHAKTSRLAHRKSASSHYYLAGSLALIRTILVGWVGSISTTLVFSIGWKAVKKVGLL